MAYLISLIVAIGILVGFFALSDYETRRGTRFFVPFRSRLDRDVEHIAFVLAHIDIGAFVLTEMRHMASRAGHAIVHVSLQAVRAAERLLTRLVLYFRTKHAVESAPRESMRKYVKTLSDFKDHMRTTRPEMPDIQ